MNALRLAVIMIITIALQVGLLPAWRPFGVVPDLFGVSIIILALITTASQALIWGMIGGLVLDLSSAVNFGQNLGLYAVVALGVATLVRLGIAFDSPSWRGGLTIAFVLVSNAIAVIELALAHVHLPVGLIVLRCIVALVFALILMWGMRPLIGRTLHASDEMSLGALK